MNLVYYSTFREIGGKIDSFKNPVLADDVEFALGMVVYDRADVEFDTGGKYPNGKDKFGILFANGDYNLVRLSMHGGINWFQSIATLYSETENKNA